MIYSITKFIESISSGSTRIKFEKLAFKTDKTAKLVNDKPQFLLRQQLHLRVILSAIKIY